MWRTSKNNYYSVKGSWGRFLTIFVKDLCSLSLGMDKGLCVPQQKASVALTCAAHQSIWEHVSQERTLRWHQHQFSHLRGNKKSHLMSYLLILFWKSVTLQKLLASLKNVPPHEDVHTLVWLSGLSPDTEDIFVFDHKTFFFVEWFYVLYIYPEITFNLPMTGFPFFSSRRFFYFLLPSFYCLLSKFYLSSSYLRIYFLITVYDNYILYVV